MNGVTNPELRDKIAAYIGETDDIMKSQAARIEELTQKCASLEKLAKCGGCDEDDCPDCNSGYEKKASLEKTAVDETVNKIIQAGFLKEAHRQQALQAIADDPAGALLDFIDKLAAQRIALAHNGAQMPKLGHAVSTGQESVSAQEVRDSDRSFEQTFDNLAVMSQA